jgi:hypothetical protein
MEDTEVHVLSNERSHFHIIYRHYLYTCCIPKMQAPDKKNNDLKVAVKLHKGSPSHKCCRNIWWQYYEQCILGLQGPSTTKYHARPIQNQ